MSRSNKKPRKDRSIETLHMLVNSKGCVMRDRRERRIGESTHVNAALEQMEDDKCQDECESLEGCNPWEFEDNFLYYDDWYEYKKRCDDDDIIERWDE